MNKKNKRWLASALLVTPTAVLLLLAAACFSCKKPAEPNNPSPALFPAVPEPPPESLTIAGHPFTIELAYSQARRRQGLMFRTSLPKNGGMIFIFPNEKVRTFYMKNCRIDLDILFLAADGTIVKTTAMKAPAPGAPLVYYSSDFPARYALELTAGTIPRLGLQPGQVIVLTARIKNILPDPD